MTLDFLASESWHPRQRDALIQLRFQAFGTDRSWEYGDAGINAPFMSMNGVPLQVACRLARDITDEREAETALVLAQQRGSERSRHAGVFRRTPTSHVFPPISEARPFSA